MLFFNNYRVNSSEINEQFGVERADHQNKDGRHSRAKPLIKKFEGGIFSGEASPWKCGTKLSSHLAQSCDRIFNYVGERFLSFTILYGSLTIPLLIV